MVFYVGCIHPSPFNRSLMNSLAPGYALTRDELVTFTGQIIGLPITYEHQGVFQAVSNLTESRKPLAGGNIINELETLANTNPVTKVLGSIVDYFECPNGSWWIIFRIDGDKFEAITWLIDKRELI